MADLLQLQNVTVARGQRTIVHNISFALGAGEILAIVGPNGSGKSTLLRAIVGLLPLAAGEVKLGERALQTLTRNERACRIAYVPQQSALEAALPVEEVVAQGRYAHAPSVKRNRQSNAQAVLLAMQQADVLELRYRSYNQLSYGERRRVLLARALATDAPVLLLDEPTAALDIRHVLMLFQILKALAASGKTVVVVLHQLLEVVDVATRALLLNEGKVVQVGSVEQVVNTQAISQVYGVELTAGKFWYRLKRP